MKLSEQVKPISYLKAHAPEIIRTLKDSPQPVVITLHGEAKAILQDVGQYEETQETLALLKVLVLTNRSDRWRPATEWRTVYRGGQLDGSPDQCPTDCSSGR